MCVRGGRDWFLAGFQGLDWSKASAGTEYRGDVSLSDHILENDSKLIATMHPSITAWNTTYTNCMAQRVATEVS